MAVGSKYRLRQFGEILGLDAVVRKSEPIQGKVIGFFARPIPPLSNSSNSVSLPFIPSQLPLDNLTNDALRLGKISRDSRHPVQSTVCRLCKGYPVPGEAGHDCLGFKSAESHYRSGAQGLRLPEIPQLPQSLVQLSRLSIIEKAGRAAIRRWLENHGQFFDEAEFLGRWQSQGIIGGAEHQVFAANRRPLVQATLPPRQSEQSRGLLRSDAAACGGVSKNSLPA